MEITFFILVLLPGYSLFYTKRLSSFNINL
jgi:hypothetical protein